MVFMDSDNRIALKMVPMFVILMLLTLYRSQIITNIITLLQVSIALCIRATYNVNIYVKQSNTTLKDVNTHRATCFG
jgi:cytochrome c biogenesis protein ResB